MDLDASDAEAPPQIVVWEANETGGMEAQEVYCLDVTSYDGCKRAVVVLELHATRSPIYRTEV